MLFSQQVATKPLTEFLRRMAMSLEAGIDIRKALTSEAQRCGGNLGPRIQQINSEIQTGTPLAEALESTGDFFPPLVHEMVEVGEQTGHLPEVLRRLSEHYEEQTKLRRMFMSQIWWPLIQLGMALFVVGLMIWISGVIPTIGDVFGLGLKGTPGLIAYLIFLGAIAAGGFVIYRGVATGKLWVAPLQRLALRIPVIGTALRTLAVARFAWTLQLTMGVAIDVKRALAFSLASTHNAEFTAETPRVLNAISQGESIHEALAATHKFPIEMLHAVQVGEESGRLVESLDVVARQQLEEARRALAVLTKAAGYLIWALVAGLIIVMIFRLFGSYLNTINNALNFK